MNQSTVSMIQEHLPDEFIYFVDDVTEHNRLRKYIWFSFDRIKMVECHEEDREGSEPYFYFSVSLDTGISHPIYTKPEAESFLVKWGEYLKQKSKRKSL